MAGLGLQQKEQIAIFLGALIVGKETLLRVGGIIEMTGNFILLEKYRCE